MLQAFLNQAPVQLQIRDEEVKKGNAEVVEREAHKLKGIACNLSVNRMADLALELELLGRAGDLSDAHEIVDNLKYESERLERYIHKSLKTKSTL